MRAVWKRWKRERRLKKIMKACKLNIKLTAWQKHFILDEKAVFPNDVLKRRTGKTLAVILRILVWNPPVGIEMLNMLLQDPDAGETGQQLRWTFYEFRKCANACQIAGVRFRWRRLTDEDMRTMLVAKSSLGK